MKKLLLLPLVLLLAFVSGCTRIDAGHAGIVVNLSGKNRGVQDYTVSTGWVYYNPIGTSVFEYPTSVQTYQWTKSPNEGSKNDESITFTTKESVSINADISVSYQLEAALIPAFYVKFRNDDLKTFTFGYMHNITRDAFMEVGGHYTVEQVMGDNEQFLHAVRDRVQENLKPIGVNLQQLGFIGTPRPPNQVIESINLAQQAKYNALRVQNELAQTQAEVAKMVANADGLAKSNRILSESITPNLLEKQRLDIQDRWISRWNGNQPSVVAGAGGGLFFNIQKPPQ